jgi:hypothetical protein
MDLTMRSMPTKDQEFLQCPEKCTSWKSSNNAAMPASQHCSSVAPKIHIYL